MQTTVNLIGGLLNQLLATLASKIPEEMYAVYEQKHYRERRSAELSDLTSMYRLACQKFSRVYIGIDALDECKDSTVTELLEFLHDVPSSVRIFTTSRKHIKKQIESQFEGTLEITIEASENDIRAFVESKISEDRIHDPDIMDEKLEEEIPSKIVDLSLGMCERYNLSLSFFY